MSMLVNGIGCAGAAVMLGNPIGAMGGAIYGASCFVVEKMMERIPVLQNIRSVVKPILCCLGGWKLAGLFGVSMTLKSVVILELTAVGLCFGVIGVLLGAGWCIRTASCLSQ